MGTVLLMLIIGNIKLRQLGDPYRHDLHTEFQDNPSFNSKVISGERTHTHTHTRARACSGACARRHTDMMLPLTFLPKRVSRLHKNKIREIQFREFVARH
jgi:hypothetical protein